ncbi:MAG: hypothetical protein Q6373_021580 [Candidatus Sigynarchaeota archaeon]
MEAIDARQHEVPHLLQVVRLLVVGPHPRLARARVDHLRPGPRPVRLVRERAVGRHVVADALGRCSRALARDASKGKLVVGFLIRHGAAANQRRDGFRAHGVVEQVEPLLDHVRHPVAVRVRLLPVRVHGLARDVEPRRLREIAR